MTVLIKLFRRWDSGIPDRAPPPLPLNTTNGSPATKPNTSAGIAAAAKQIVERARESTPLSTYTSNASGSPERSLIKGGVQKRMQSLQKLQTGNVKDLRNYLDNNNNRSPERAPDRPTSRGAYLPYNRMSSIEDDPFDPPSPTLPERDPSKDTPTPRPSSRQPCKAILGENTPPSATMLALQNMQLPEMPPSLADMTNRPSTPGGTRVPTQYDFSSQLLNITTIATNLQKEMAQLSRRSKDNATDLLALKSATHSRDEDIRKTLKELAGSVTSSIPQQLLGPPPLGTPRSQSFGNFYPDGNMFSSPPSASKRHSMPRAQSAHSFADDARCGSPSPYSVEGAASVAMLEKIIREMVTKEGQERLQSTLAELLEKSRRDNVDAAKKVEELSEFIKLKSQSQALVHMPNGDGPPQLDLNFDTPRKDSKKESNSAAQDEVLRLLQRIKDSISHSGGTTSEVKGLVRDLRGEVLGMGRELGKKLDQIGESHANTTADRSANENREMEHLEEIQRVVEEGLSELKQHMTMALKQRAEQDDDAFKQLSTTRAGADGDEVLAVVKHALAEHSSMFSKPTAEADVPTLDKEGVLDAVKEGLKDFEPNIELQQFGLERDEILAVLQEGLEEYRNTRAEPPVANIDKGEIFEVMQEALKDFQAPYPEAQLSELKDELLGTIRQTLEDFKPPPVDAAVNQEVLHAAVFDAIKLGMENHGPSAPRELEISRNDLFDAVKASLDGSAIPFGGIGEQVISQMQELIDGMRGEFKQYSAANGRDTEQVLDAVNDGLERLRVDVESYVDKAQDVTGKDEIVDSVKMGLEQLRQDVQGYCAQGPVNDTGKSEMLDYIKSEFEHLHTTMANRETSRDLDASDVATVDEIKESTAKSSSGALTDEQLEAIRGEFENLRTSIASSVVHSGSNEEVLDALRLGLDDLRSHLEKKLDNPESVVSHQGQVLDALNEHLESLRTDVIKTLDKPLDMTVNYEILDTLKDGLTELRAEMSKLTSGSGASQGGLIVLGDAPEAEASREVSADAPGNESVQRADLEKVEVLLAQLQIKIEAMDHTVQDMPRSALPVDGAAMKEDLAGLESMIRELQESTMAAKSERGPEGAALKEDTDAIETLLRNTKAHLEEIKLPDPETAITQDNLDEVHAAVRVTNEALETLTEKLEATSASKGDVAAVETLAADIKTMTEGLKEKLEAMSEEAKPEVMTKADLDVLGVLCTEIKTSVNEIALPNPEDLPSKADIESLQGLIADFRESHDKMRDSYETDIAVTAKAFDDRKQEFEDTINQLGEVKTLIEGVKDELVEKMSDGELKLSIDTFGATLASLEEKSGHEDVISEVKEVMEKVKEEFERAHESLEAIKTDNAQSSETVLERHSEHKDAIIKELTEKLDGLFDGLMSKYDDAQKAAEAKSAMVEEKAQEQQELLNSTKVMTDDLKLSIDTLGTAMTTFMAELPSTMEKMAEESKTVFNQALETHSKLEETTETLKGEHLATRDEVAKVLAAVDIVQSDMSEHNPRFMVTLEEVRALINQHYEHSQQTSEAAAEQAQATSLPTLLPAAVEVAPSVEKYDDAAVHEKLDKLMGHVEEAGDRSIQVERLDQIHEKVMATAAEVSAFVAAQNKQIIADHESKEKEAEEIGLLLERRLERKDQLEADITVLNEEKETLQQAVESLKAEKEALAVQKSRLNADVSAMQTALLIRRDELHEMDNKALAIERRMLEGVMNQSRMLLLSKTAKPAPKKKPQGRDLRVPSNASAMSSHTVTSSVPDLKPLHAMAMKSRPGLNRNGPAPNTAERRIMSLNQIAHNVPTGAHAFVPAVEKASLLSGMQSGGMKRSHSVKTNFMQRKPSWSTKRNASMTVHNKENETLSEADEEDDLESPGAGVSEAGTVDRRESYLSGTDGSMTYGTGSYITDGETPELESRRSYAPSDMTYDTGSYLTGGSYMTGSEIDRRTSLGSISNSAAGIVAGGETSTIDEEEEEAEAELGAERVVAKEDDESPLEMPPQIGKSEWAPPSDSGLGTDCPTAMLSGGEDYFK
ncbi:uncharacterized protein MYCGRDRAFT_73105 [Zymoseptoria tritici IPO323]|uniref:Chromosome segregation ATPase family protein n=1 Tax=Zymoseptoria tritici (strain CBS 115943 / IPO323) TaxID=336722 RepID=F9XDB7_ZYMTI|nr:uncharacterized protein MYCGRDRAFT_73105 [Zymoseptoria tritici IPO323]EGP86464.1 hypothetical protein MYCGRDRAFT_73105 [Zymoseptoria tritici IPO323]